MIICYPIITMNEIARIAPQCRPTTQAADGTPRLKWSLADFERLTELGIFSDADRIELIGGELVPMSPKGVRHETVRWALSKLLRQRLPIDIEYQQEPGWRPQGREYLEPDILIFPAGHSPVSVAPSDVLLIIEVAATSLAFDTGLKAKTYASLGVREYWVVDAVSLETRVFQDPSPQGYGREMRFAPDKTVTPQLVPVLAMRIDDLQIPRT